MHLISLTEIEHLIVAIVILAATGVSAYEFLRFKIEKAKRRGKKENLKGKGR